MYIYMCVDAFKKRKNFEMLRITIWTFSSNKTWFYNYKFSFKKTYVRCGCVRTAFDPYPHANCDQ